MTELSRRQWLNSSGGLSLELRCTDFLTKATSHTSASAMSATGRYSPRSLAFPRAQSTRSRNLARWLQSLPKKRQHRTMLRSRSKENQTWPDQDRLSGSAVQIRDVTTTLSLLLLNTIPHSWTGFSWLPMGQSLHQVN